MTARMHQYLRIAALCAALTTPSVARAQSASRATGNTTSGAVPVRAPVASAAAAPVEGQVNINGATEDELVRLPGIGPARAAAIVALRQRVQHFRAADDLLRVRGIGRAGLRRLRPYVTLTGATTLLARPGRQPSEGR